MENKAIPSLEHLIQDAVNNKSDFVRIDSGIYAVIRPNEILYIKKENLDNYKNFLINQQTSTKRDFLSITFVPTLNCNLNCIYCYSKGGAYKDSMSPYIANSFLESMYDSTKHSSINLRFAGGGEPFLNFECIKESTKVAKQLSKKVSIHCITNGTFDDDKLKWILENKPHMRVSYDGEICQKIQRPFRDNRDSSSIIRKNIKELSKNNIEVVTQSTITSLNVKYIKETISEAHELGVKTIKMEPVYITNNSRGNNKLNVSPEKFVSEFLGGLKFIRKNNLDIQIDTAYFSRPTLGHYCNMPTGNIILTPKGEISGCVEITNNCDYHSEDVFYAKFDEKSKIINFDNQKKDLFRKFHFINYNNCPSCNLKFICRGGCPLRRIWGQNEHSCKITKRLVPQLLRLFYKDLNYTKILIRK